MLGKQNIVYVIQELRERNDHLRQISWPISSYSLLTHSFNFDKKLNAALRHSSKRLDIEHQCLQIRTYISHKITKQRFTIFACKIVQFRRYY